MENKIQRICLLFKNHQILSIAEFQQVFNKLPADTHIICGLYDHYRNAWGLILASKTFKCVSLGEEYPKYGIEFIHSAKRNQLIVDYIYNLASGEKL